MKKTYLSVFMVILLSLSLVACSGDQDEGASETEVEISEDEKYDEDEVIVTVNDDDVTGRTYNLVYSQLKLEASHTGQDLTEEEIKELTIESLIDRQLLLQEAEEVGIVVTEEEVAKELDKIKEENQEGIDILLEQYQITEDLLLHQLVYEFTYEEFIDQEIELELTKEDVEDAYEEMKKENEDLPELTEMYDTFKKHLEQMRKGEALRSRIEKLKDDARVERHI